LDPLGCTNTRVYGSSGDARGTPMDLARIGQMLLNGGAYGDKRFLRKSTIDGMLPAPMTKQFGPNTTVVKGFGCQLLSGTPLGKRTINHGAASSATFAVDLDNELVIVMCRDRAGKNFETYHPQFLKAVAENLANGK
jgi:CubicO group peptidase (beta-lactamase class C family)